MTLETPMNRVRSIDFLGSLCLVVYATACSDPGEDRRNRSAHRADGAISYDGGSQRGDSDSPRDSGSGSDVVQDGSHGSDAQWGRDDASSMSESWWTIGNRMTYQAVVVDCRSFSTHFSIVAQTGGVVYGMQIYLPIPPLAAGRYRCAVPIDGRPSAGEIVLAVNAPYPDGTDQEQWRCLQGEVNVSPGARVAMDFMNLSIREAEPRPNTSPSDSTVSGRVVCP